MHATPSIVLHKAEMCWRQHHITMISMALAYDLTNILNVETGTQSLKELAKEFRSVKIFLELSDLLSDNKLLVHPLVSGRIDISDKAIELTRNKELVATAMEITNYFSFDTQAKVNAIKKTIVRYPGIKRLYYLFSENMHVSKRIGAVHRINNLKFAKDTDEEIIFTELAHMAIGHLGYILDIVSVLKANKIDSKILIAETPDSACETLLKYAYNINLNILKGIRRINRQQLLEMPIYYLANLYVSCNPTHISFTTPKRLKAENSQYNNTEVKRTKGKAIMHLRTGNYKYNDQARTMNIRSVVPSSYEKMIRLASQKNFIITNATADFQPSLVKGAKLLHVTDKEMELSQWREYLSSEFMIGTQSGISHLTILCNYKVLLTNYTALPYDHMHLSSHSLVACKRFDIKKNIPYYNSIEVLSLFMNQWGHEKNGLDTLVEVEDLNEDELVRAFEEFIQLSSGETSNYTLYSILEKYKLTYLKIILPNTNLFSETYRDLDKIMSYSNSSLHR